MSTSKVVECDVCGKKLCSQIEEEPMTRFVDCVFHVDLEVGVRELPNPAGLSTDACSEECLVKAIRKYAEKLRAPANVV